MAQIDLKGYPRINKTHYTLEAAQQWIVKTERDLRERNPVGWPTDPFEVLCLKRIDPFKRDSGVYFLFNGDKCVYVGMSENVHQRVLQHRTKKAGKKVFTSYAWLPMPKEKLAEAEKHFIAMMKPPLNLIGTGEWKGKPRKAQVRVQQRGATREQRVADNALAVRQYFEKKRSNPSSGRR